MTDKIKLAFDRMGFDKKSVRFFDADGRLHVEKTNISKATVNPYYGYEIPDHEALGLDPNKIYHLLRHPDELAKAASTFNNIPLLIKHIPVNADKPELEYVAGTVGSNAGFEAPYLTNSIAVWDQEGIDAIEDEEKRELSCAYRYRADMTPGTYNGVHYDGIMRDLIGNHVALVKQGRAGPDVLVADENPFIKKESTMNIEQLKKLVKSALVKKMANKMATDENIEEVIEAIVEAVSEEPGAGANDNNSVLEFLKGKISEEDLEKLRTMLSSASDNDPDDPPADDPKGAKDNDPPAEPKAKDNEVKEETITKAAMDSAIKDAEKRVRREVEALSKARSDVAPLVGHVTMDSADAVYKFALDHLKVKTAGVDPSAYPELFKMAKQLATTKSSTPVVSTYAADSATTDSMLAALPNARKFLKGEK